MKVFSWSYFLEHVWICSWMYVGLTTCRTSDRSTSVGALGLGVYGERELCMLVAVCWEKKSDRNTKRLGINMILQGVSRRIRPPLPFVVGTAV